MAPFPFIHHLTRLYTKKAEASGHWADYGKAHGLANYCTIKYPDNEELKQQVWYIERSWYKGKHPLTYDEHQSMIRRHKQQLELYREDVQTELDSIAEDYDTLDIIDNMYSEENLKQAENISHKVFQMSKKFSATFVSFSRSIIECSVNVLDNFGVKPPCPFAVVGIGDTARGEVTPYSSLEFAIIVKSDKDVSYFRSLEVDIHFRVANLGETPLRSYGIKELSDNGQKDLDTTSECHCRGEIVGYRIEPMTSVLHTAPVLSEGADPIPRHIRSVDGMFKLYKLYDKSLVKEGNPLMKSVNIYSSPPTQSLYNRYHDKVMNYERKDVRYNDAVLNHRCERLIRHLTNPDYRLLPKFEIKKREHQANIKTQALMADYWLRLVDFSQEPSKVWDALPHLQTNGYENLPNILLGLSLYTHTRSDISLTTCCDWLLKHCTRHEALSEGLVPAALYTTFLCLFISTHRAVLHSSVEYEHRRFTGARYLKMFFSPGEQSVATLLRQLLHSSLVSQDDRVHSAEILLFAGNYQGALNQLNLSCDIPSNTSEDQSSQPQMFIDQLCRKYNVSKTHQKLNYAAEIRCLLFFHTAKHKQAMEYLRFVTECRQCNRSGIRRWQTFAAERSAAGEYEQANAIIDQLISRVSAMLNLDDREEITDYFKPLPESGKKHVEAVIFCMLLAELHRDHSTNSRRLSLYKEAINHLELTVELYQCLDTKYHTVLPAYHTDVGQLYSTIGDYPKALERHQKALASAKEQFGQDKNHSHISICYQNIARVYFEMRNYKLAIDFEMKSLTMNKALLGGAVNTASLAVSYTNIADAHLYMASHAKCLEYYFKAVDVHKALHGAETNHSDIGRGYNGIASVYCSMGDQVNSLKYYSKSLNMSLSLHGKNSNHADVALVHTKMAAVYTSAGDYTKAVECCTRALAMWRSLYGAHANHAHIAMCYTYIAGVALGKLDFDRALEYQHKSLEMRKALYGPHSNHPDIISGYNCLGIVYGSKGKYSYALDCYMKALSMCRVLEADNESDVHLATCYYNIAVVYSNCSDYTKSLKYYKASLKIDKNIYGERATHPNLAGNYMGMAIVYANMGDYPRSMEYHTMSLDMRVAFYGAGRAHVTLGSNLSSIGEMYLHSGHHAKSLEYLNKALDMHQRLNREDVQHDLASCYSRIACVHTDRANYGLATEYHFKSLAMLKSSYGSTISSYIARSYDRIGQLYSAMAEPIEALKYQFEALDMMRQLHDNDDAHPLIAFIYSDIGIQKMRMGHHSNSLEYHRKSLALREDAFRGYDNHPSIAQCYDDIGAVYLRMKDWSHAVEYHRKALDMVQVLYGGCTSHRIVASCCCSLGKVFSDMGEYKQSLEYHIKALDMRKALYKDDTNHPSIAACYYHIGNMYSQKGEPGEALDHYLQCLTMRKSLYGEDTDHPDIADCYRMIGQTYYSIADLTNSLMYLNKSVEMHRAVRSTLVINKSLNFLS